MPARYVITTEHEGARLDVALAERAGISRSQARRWIDEGRVRLNQSGARASLRVQAGDQIAAAPPDLRPSTLEPEALPLDVLYEDRDLIVIDKPAGLVVHPAPGHPSGTLVHALLHHCEELSGIGGVLRPGIVHRLDRGTSGVLVAAKSDAAHTQLAEQFRAHSVERVYLALVRAVPGADTGRADAAIGRHPRDRKRMSVRAQVARAARTAWRVRERFPQSGCSLLEVRPETGRTHQIRVHLAAAGLPIAGDPIYGAGRPGAATRGSRLERPALHAAVLGFAHPIRGEAMRFEAPLPPDFTEVLDRCARAEEASR